MKINKIIESVLYSDNAQEMFDFYQNIFGFEVITNSLPRGFFLRIGNESILAVFNRSLTSQEGQLAPFHGSTGPQHMSFEIPDEEYDMWKEHLIRKGVAIEKEIDWPNRNNGAKSLFIRDPAGNNIEIAQKKLWTPEGIINK